MSQSSSRPPSPPDAPTGLNRHVEAVMRSFDKETRIQHIDATFLPRRDEAIELLRGIRDLVFPGFFSRQRIRRDSLDAQVRDLLAHVRDGLETQIEAALRYRENQAEQGAGDACADCAARAREIADQFLDRLPELRRLLALDVQAAYDGDPACRHTDEAVFCYPGVYAIFVHRVAHELFRMEVPLLPRILNEHAHSQTGIDIHPGAKIGESFFIDHGTGVVVGETSIIGDRVKLYQSVTIGAPAAHLSQAARGVKRHPTVEDDVVIYANATILGGNTTIGKGSVIGGGVFLTSSVPPGHFVYNKPQELKFRSAEKVKALSTLQD